MLCPVCKAPCSHVCAVEVSQSGRGGAALFPVPLMYTYTNSAARSWLVTQPLAAPAARTAVRFSLDFLAFLWISSDFFAYFFWDFLGFHSFSLDFIGFPYFSWGFLGFLCFSFDSIAFLKISLDFLPFHAICSTNSLRCSLLFIRIHGFLSLPDDFL